MRCKLTIVVLLLIASLAPCELFAQKHFLPSSRSYNLRYQKEINKVGNDFHSSVQPYLSTQLKKPWRQDTNKFYNEGGFYKKWLGRKMFSEDLIRLKHKDIDIYINPLFDFHVGQDNTNNFSYYTNTRGVWLRGRLGNRVTISSTLRENQARFPLYVDSLARNYFVVPGQGRVKINDTQFDYNNMTGSVTFDASDIFTFQLGHDRNFIGDGYRSLILSDNSFVYPFFKIVTDVWKIRYVNLYTVFQDHTRGRIDDEIFPRKYGSFHYLDFRIGKRLTLGLFEGIIFSADSNNTRGYDFNYMNPIIFLRSVEFSIGSPDNAFIGMNWKYKITDQVNAYGQIMMDEFKLDEIRADFTNAEQSGWWGNKYGIQLGAKAVEPFQIDNLIVQGEYNMVRPYTYSHRDSQKSYGHYNQPLAHPLGANFWEVVLLADYSYKNLLFACRFSTAKVGHDVNDVNFGQNIFRNYNDRPYEYGHHLLQGDERTITHTSFTVGYLLNPVNNMRIEVEGHQRMYERVSNSQNETFFNVRFRTNIFNRYYDF